MKKNAGSKKKYVIVMSGVCIVLLGIVLLGLVSTGEQGLFKGSRDTYTSDVSYTDDSRMLTNGAHIKYESEHKKIEKYDIKTGADGKLPITYKADIESGNVTLRVVNNKDVIKQLEVSNSGKQLYQLNANTNYTIEIIMYKGKGEIDFTWMEEF